ncbi:class E sortase [Nonomuraea polychroma]|uniref:class E sortase n=1 Tax=Nonomuraea polychroma TaxID=46176 RepID=UPI003D90208B
MRAALRVVGELGVTAGLVLLMFCAYLLWGTASYTERHQRILQEQLDQELDQRKRKKDARGIELGRALALLSIPRLGADYKYAIVEGVDPESLRKGPGHYPGTAMPGQVGNFVISGHRTTYAAPFNRLNELRRGDDIVVDTRDARFTYRVIRKEVVVPTQLSVVAPVPQHPARRPSQALITLATCHPEYSARQRLIVYGVLVVREDRRT